MGLTYDAPSAVYENELPAGSGDVSGYDAFQFRAGLAFNDLRNNFESQDFNVVLTDGAGRSVATTVGQWSDALYYPPGKYVNGPKLILNMVRIPLLAFAGIDLSDLRSVQFKFDLRPSGSLFLTDLAFADPASSTPA